MNANHDVAANLISTMLIRDNNYQAASLAISAAQAVTALSGMDGTLTLAQVAQILALYDRTDRQAGEWGPKLYEVPNIPALVAFDRLEALLAGFAADRVTLSK